jgi:selenocysteine-specific elongation factor
VSASGKLGQPPVSASGKLGQPPSPVSGEPEQPSGPARLSSRLTLHIGAARTVAQVRMLGSRFARLTLDRPLPLHVGDRVLLRDPGAAPDRTGGRPVFGATVLDVSPPRLRGTGAAVAAARELASWPEIPAAPDLLRRHRLLRAGRASAMGLDDLPPPVAADWLADPGHWAQLRQSLALAVAAHAARDPLAPGLPVDAARAELGLPRRDLVEALAAWPASSGPGERIEAVGGYLRCVDHGVRGQPEDAGGAAGPVRRTDGRAAPERRAEDAGGVVGPAPRADGTDGRAAPEQRPDVAGHAPVPGPRPVSGAVPSPGPRLPAPVASAVQAVLADLADAPFRAPDAERLRELGIDVRAAAAAERAGLLCRLPGTILLAPDAPDRAARILAGLPQPFTTSDARQALNTTRRTAIPLLEWLDRAGVTRRLPDDRRTMREPLGSPRQNGEQ